MIKKAKSSPWKRVIVLAIIPIFGLFLWASSEPRYVFDRSETQVVPDDSIVVVGYGSMDKVSTDSLIKTKKIIVQKRKDSVSTDKNNERIEIKGVYTGSQDKAIIFIDGKKSDKTKVENLNPNDIESVSVLKDGMAVEMYGEKAKDGVIQIKTKEYAKKHPEQEIKKIQDIKVISIRKDSTNKSDNSIIIRNTNHSSGSEPLFFIDGKKVKSIQGLNPDDIESISVLKEETAISIYGTEGKNGVVLITSKKKGNTEQK